MIALRNKNAGKTLIDYDLNIFIPEELDEDQESFYDPTNWKIHVYVYRNGGHQEFASPIDLNVHEIRSLGLNKDHYFKDEVDTWYGLDGFRKDYWNKMSDRLKMYFDSLPKYEEDLQLNNN
jgi:hypothetical protein